jgi:hypothetical protein
MSMADIQTQLEALNSRLSIVEAEAGARRTLARYMAMCDVPSPMPGSTPAERCAAIADLFTPDAIWEGVGGAHGSQFGRQIGRAQIAAHFERFYTREPVQVFNTHYLCSEWLKATPPEVEGRWVQFQPWVNTQGESLLRSSRLHVSFGSHHGDWLISHYKTENLFIANLPSGMWETLITSPVLT